MNTLENGWLNYWKVSTSQGLHYYGKDGDCADEVIEILRIKKDDVILDIGCAVGAHLSDIRKKTGAECHGIDICSIPIKLNKDRKLKLKQGDMEATGYEDNFFTKVFSLGVFEHTPRSYLPFRELNRVMKEDGLAYITVPNKYSFFTVTRNVKMKLGIWTLGYERSFTKKELETLTRKAGFVIERYWVAPHSNVFNVFNFGDNMLNKMNRNHLGFFIHMLLRKVEND